MQIRKHTENRSFGPGRQLCRIYFVFKDSKIRHVNRVTQNLGDCKVKGEAADDI